MGPLPWGGSEELWAETAFEALQAGHEVFVSVVGWASPAAKLPELERRGAKILRRYNRHFPSFGAVSSYRDLFKTNPDVLVISQASSFEFVDCPDLMELLYVTPIPYVLVCQWNQNLPIMADDCRREHARNIYSRAFRVLFVSNENRIQAERQLATKISNSDVVLNPVNLSDRSYLAWPDSGTARLASIARLSAYSKGQDVLIEALSADQWKHRDWHLTIYGSGPDESYLRSLIEFFGLQTRITFAGHQSDVRAIWAKEQILVMFSRAEGTPLALVEAMLCGRPAIVADAGGNKEWVTEAQTGFVAEAPVIGLARTALERAWSARPSWKTMGMQAHKFASNRISDPAIPSLVQVLLSANRQGRPAHAEPDRLKRYHQLLQPKIGSQAKQVAEAGAIRLKNILWRWRVARDKALLQLAEPRKPSS
jgi:glycosyltransferase involved in cell wall biosynthesis